MGRGQVDISGRAVSQHPTLVIVQGFISGGKSTYARALAASTGAVHLDADAYCAETFSADELADWDRCFAIAVERLWTVAEDRLREGHSVIMDHGFWRRSSRDDARARAASLSVPLLHVHLTAPDEVLRERMARRSGGVAASNLAEFHNLKGRFQPPDTDENAIVVHSGRMSGEDASTAEALSGLTER